MNQPVSSIMKITRRQETNLGKIDGLQIPIKIKGA